MGRWSKLTRKGRWKAIMQLIKLMEVHMQLTQSHLPRGFLAAVSSPQAQYPGPSGIPTSSPQLQRLSSQQGNQVMLVGEANLLPLPFVPTGGLGIAQEGSESLHAQLHSPSPQQ